MDNSEISIECFKASGLVFYRVEGRPDAYYHFGDKKISAISLKRLIETKGKGLLPVPLTLAVGLLGDLKPYLTIRFRPDHSWRKGND